MKFKLLAMCASVAWVCQTASAQDTDYDLKSLADAPIHLVNNIETVSAAGKGVKPNVMLFIDDSGSMRSGTTDNPVATNHRGLPITDQLGRPIEKSFGQTVSGNCNGGRKHAPAFGDNRANPRDLCFFSLISTLAAAEVHPITGTMNLMVNPSVGLRYSVAHVQFTEADEKNVRLLIVMNAVHDVLDTYGDLINWNIFTLHGSEDRYSSTARPLETQRHENSSYTNVAQGRVTHRLYWGAQALSSAKPFMEAKDMRKYINSLSPLLGTPTTERYTRAAKIVADNIQYRCQKSYIVLLSDGDANGTNVDIQTKWRGQEGPNMEKLFNHKGKFALRGTQLTYNGQNYTDNGGEVFHGIGPLATSLHEQDMKNTTSPNATKATGCSSSVGLDAECQSWDDENHPTQKIETFTIGFGQSLSAVGKNYLINGGKCDLTEQQIYDKEIEEGKSHSEALKVADSNGNNVIGGSACFFNAAESTQLTNAFKHIFSAIEAATKVEKPGQDTISVTTPSTTGTSSPESAILFTLDSNHWASQLKLAELNENGGLKRKATGEVSYLDVTYNGRKVIGRINNRIKELEASDFATFGFTNKVEFEKGLLPWLQRNPAISDAQIETNVAEAKKRNEIIGDRTVSAYRDRSRVETNGQITNLRHMSDVVGASNVAVGRDTTGRQKYVVTAANDGMVYIFESNPNNRTVPYNLVLNYLPADMERQKNLTVGNSIKRIAESKYGKDVENPHIYLNNGGIGWIKTSETGKKPQEYFIFGNMGQGARGSYVLSVAGDKRTGNGKAGLDAGNDVASYLANVPFWETEKGNNNKLGYTISLPVVGQISTTGSASGDVVNNRANNIVAAMFLANGYSTEIPAIPYDTSPTLYVYDALGQEFGTDIANGTSVTNSNQAGQLLRAISTGFEKAGALSTPTLLDADLNGIYDYAFAGDEFGNLWQFNVYGAPSTWTAKMIYRGSVNSNGKHIQPITAAPELYRVFGKQEGHEKFAKEFVVVFGTGSDVYDADLLDENRQFLAGLYVDVTNPQTFDAGSRFVDQTVVDVETVRTRDDGTREKIKAKAISPELAITDGAENRIYDGWRIMLREAKTWTEDKSAEKQLPAGSEIHTYFTAAEKIVSKPEILLGTVILTSRQYTHTSKVEIKSANKSGETCGVDTTITTDTPQGNSLQLAVNAENGGNPDAEEGAYLKGYDKVKVEVQVVENGQVVTKTQDMNIIGRDLGGLASGTSVSNIRDLAHDVIQGTNYGSSGTGSGVLRSLDDPKANYTEIGVKCLDEKGKYVAGTTVANKDTPFVDDEYTGKLCPKSSGGFIRVNWREVSF